VIARLPAIRLWDILTAVLAAGYAYVGVRSPLPGVRWTALAGAALVAAALWLARRSRAGALAALAVGALAPVVLAWWSVVLPVTALLILICGSLAVLGRRTEKAVRRL